MSTKTTQTAADLADFEAFMLQDSTRLEIDLPNGDPMLFNGARVAVLLRGPSTPEYVKALAVQQREAMERVMRAGGNKKVKPQQDDEESDAKFLSAITVAFENFPFPGGPGAIYRERRLLYIGAQVEKHLKDLGNFFTPQATN